MKKIHEILTRYFGHYGLKKVPVEPGHLYLDGGMDVTYVLGTEATPSIELSIDWAMEAISEEIRRQSESVCMEYCDLASLDNQSCVRNCMLNRFLVKYGMGIVEKKEGKK